MPTPTVVEFLNKSTLDTQLHLDVQQALSKGLNEVVELGAKHGFVFTAAQFQETVSEALAMQTSPDAIAEADLDTVVGGAGGGGGAGKFLPAVLGVHSYISWGLNQGNSLR